MRLLRSGCAVAAASVSLLGAAPAAADDSFEIRAVAGVPRADLVGGRARTWRNVTVRAESETLDVAVRLPDCVPTSSSAAPAWAGSDSRCLSGSDYAVNRPGLQYSATWKVPQWIDGGPLLDATVRRWDSPLRQERSSSRATGNAVVLTLAQPLGALELLAGVSVPFASSESTNDGRSVYAGISWRPMRGTTLEFTADATDPRESPFVDRAYTVRYTFAPTGSTLRVGLWLTRSSGYGDEPWRGGLGLEYRY